MFVNKKQFNPGDIFWTSDFDYKSHKFVSMPKTVLKIDCNGTPIFWLKHDGSVEGPSSVADHARRYSPSEELEEFLYNQARSAEKPSNFFQDAFLYSKITGPTDKLNEIFSLDKTSEKYKMYKLLIERNKEIRNYFYNGGEYLGKDSWHDGMTCEYKSNYFRTYYSFGLRRKASHESDVFPAVCYAKEIGQSAYTRDFACLGSTSRPEYAFEYATMIDKRPMKKTMYATITSPYFSKLYVDSFPKESIMKILNKIKNSKYFWEHDHNFNHFMKLVNEKKD